MIRTMLAVVATTTTIAVAQDQAPSSSIPAPRSVECKNFVALDEKGVVQHYEDCTPSDGLVMRCEVLNTTDSRGKVRKIQNCALVSPPNK
jgi:hypothetical protein